MNNQVHSASQAQKERERGRKKDTHYKQLKIYNSYNGLEKYIHNLSGLEK